MDVEIWSGDEKCIIIWMNRGFVLPPRRRVEQVMRGINKFVDRQFWLKKLFGFRILSIIWQIGRF